MNYKLIFRVLSIVFSIVAIILLGWLWKKGYKDYSFIPLLFVAIALFCSRLSRVEKWCDIYSSVK